MPIRPYYSARTGRNPNTTKFDLTMLLRLFRDLYLVFDNRCYFQEAFGYHCVDAGDVSGALGVDIEAQIFRRIRKHWLWPIAEKCHDYSEEDVFDIIEFLYDHVARPVDGYYHSYGGCGWHYATFNTEEGRKEWQDEMNAILRDYREGYELSLDGEILALPENGLETLLQATLPTHDPENIEIRVNNAVLKFRRYRSSPEDRRDAIRDLADVLEFLRPKLNEVITKKDECDLFRIANNFGIRHHNDTQQTDYDKAIWYSWMFYYYLATIHASLRLIERYGNGNVTTQR